MRRLKFIVLCVFTVISVNAQILTVPTDYAKGGLRDSLINWTSEGGLVPYIDGVEGTSSYYISTDWSPLNAILNTMVTNGCNTSNWPLYFRASDSTIFTQDVSLTVGLNSYSILGRYTETVLTWGDYVNGTHELWWNSLNDQYYILASKVDGTLMTLSEVVAVKNAYAALAGYLTVPGKDALTQSNLWKRISHDTWAQPHL